MSVARPTPSLARLVFAWSGAAAFVASLGFFLFSYLVTFASPAPGGPNPRAYAFDLVLFTLFGAHHSVFARQPVRAAIARVLPAELERSAYVWVASLLLFAVCWWWQPLPGTVWTVTGAGRWGLHALQAAGVWITLRSAGMIDIWDLAGIRQLTGGGTMPTEGAGDPQDAASRVWAFTTTGPYGWVRHPIYSGWFLLVFAVTTMTTTRLIFALASAAYLLIAMPLEERTLQAQSAGAYDRYMQKVRWKLVPRVY